jgi:hypothetical protein
MQLRLHLKLKHWALASTDLLHRFSLERHPHAGRQLLASQVVLPLPQDSPSVLSRKWAGLGAALPLLTAPGIRQLHQLLLHRRSPVVMHLITLLVSQFLANPRTFLTDRLETLPMLHLVRGVLLPLSCLRLLQTSMHFWHPMARIWGSSSVGLFAVPLEELEWRAGSCLGEI